MPSLLLQNVTYSEKSKVYFEVKGEQLNSSGGDIIQINGFWQFYSFILEDARAKSQGQ